MTQDSSTFLFDKIKRTAHAVKEWDKNLAYKIQGKFKLSNYQLYLFTNTKFSQ